MSEPRPQLGPTDELPPLRPAESPNDDSLPKFSGKYVAIALFVGVMKFYWENRGDFLLVCSYHPESLIVALAEGFLLTICAMALHGRYGGKPFFREPGHWLALLASLESLRPLIRSFMYDRGFEEPGLWDYCLAYLGISCNFAPAILGVIFLKLFYSRSQVFDSWAWRAALLFIGVTLTTTALVATGFVFEWIDYPAMETARSRVVIVNMLAGLAVGAAAVSDTRHKKQRHWTHSCAVCAWLVIWAIKAYWEFSPQIESWFEQ